METTRPGHRISHGGDMLGIGRIGSDPALLQRSRAGGQRSIRDPLWASGGIVGEMHMLQQHFHKVMSREIVREHGCDAAPGEHARGKAAGRIPAQSLPALHLARFIRLGIQSAHDREEIGATSG